MFHRWLLLIFFPFVLFFSSCNADVDLQNISGQVNLHPDLIIPIGSAEVSLGDILKNYISTGSFQVDSNGVDLSYVSIDSLNYDFGKIDILGNAKTLNAEISFPNILIPYVIPANTALPTLESNDTLDLGINGSNKIRRIDSILVDSARFYLNIDTKNLPFLLPQDVKITVTFPDNRVVFANGQKSLTIFPTSFGSPTQIDLNNFLINTSGNLEGIPIHIRVDAITDQFPVVLMNTSKIDFSLKLAQLKFNVAYGNFESMANVTTKLNRKLDLSGWFTDAMLNFINPQIFIHATSNIGAYLNFNVDYLKTYSSTQAGDTVYAWFNNHTTNSFVIPMTNRPRTPGTWINQNFRTFDDVWGETNQLFGSVTKNDSLALKLSVSIDHGLTQYDPLPEFLTPDAGIHVYMKTVIPFYLDKGSYYNFKDSITNISVPISSALDNNLKSYTDTVSLVLNIKNGLPIQTDFSYKLLDAHGKELLAGLKKNYNIQSGIVDGDGIVQPGKESNQLLIIQIPTNAVSDLKNAHSFVYTIGVAGKDMNPKIHFTVKNSMKVNVGLFINGKISTRIGK